MMASLVRLALGSALLALTEAGHDDMFSCRKGSCTVVELTDDNFDANLGAAPHFVMFYAPWCGHCKTLAPKMKKAAKEVEETGIKLAACDVEPNRNVQSKFSDIKGFPTIKFLPSTNVRKAVNYEGAREADAIAQFIQEQAKKLGTGGEPVPVKANHELYSFMGRSALDNKPALLIVGAARAEKPSWAGKLVDQLRQEKDPDAVKPEAATRSHVEDAIKATKSAEARAGLKSVLETLDALEKKDKGAVLVSPAYTNDDAAAELLGLSKDQRPAIVLAAVDRKTAGGTYVLHPTKPVKGAKPDVKELAVFLKDQLAHVATPAALAAHAGDAAAPLPAFPKPANVLAAEERARKREESSGTIAAVDGGAALTSKCYGLEAKTCCLLLLDGGATAAAADAELAALAKKYAKDNFAFAALDAASADLPDALRAAVLGEEGGATPALAVVKGGKRPRVARASGGAADFGSLLDAVVGGGASFAKLSGGLPEWPAPEGAGGSDEGADTGGGWSDDDL